MNKHIEELREAYTDVEITAHNLRGNPEEYRAVTGFCPVNVIEMQAQKILELLAKLEAAEKERGQLRKQLEAADNDLEAERQLTAEITEQYVDRTTALSFATRRAEAAEARLLVPVKLPSERFQYHESDYDDGHSAGWNSYRLEAIKEVTAAGYPVEGGE